MLSAPTLNENEIKFFEYPLNTKNIIIPTDLRNAN